MDKRKIKADKKEFTAHVKRICKINEKRNRKICFKCPFRKYVQIMKENDWKLPKNCKIEASKEEFTKHVGDFCRSNIRKGIKICRVCPFREYVFEIIKENGWKLPENYEEIFNLNAAKK